MGWRASTVLSWAGMRGVVTLAVALSVPADMPGRDFLLVAAFAVILVTVLLQGTTLGLVIRWLRPPDAGAHVAPLNMSQAEVAMAQAQVKLVEARAYAPDGTLIHPQLLERYQRRADHLGRTTPATKSSSSRGCRRTSTWCWKRWRRRARNCCGCIAPGRSMTACCTSWSATWISRSWARCRPRPPE